MGSECGNCPEAQTCYFSHILSHTWLIFDQCIGPVPFKSYWSWRWSRIYSSGFLLGFFGLRERLLALHNGQMGALRWICWWQDRQAWREGRKFQKSFCCLVETNKLLSQVVSDNGFSYHFLCVWHIWEPITSWKFTLLFHYYERNYPKSSLINCKLGQKIAVLFSGQIIHWLFKTENVDLFLQPHCSYFRLTGAIPS